MNSKLSEVRHEERQLVTYGGHIGYSVRPNERRKGYAKKMLADCLVICKSYDLERVLVTCETENDGSKHTMQMAGNSKALFIVNLMMLR